MIRSFKDVESRRIFDRQYSSRYPKEIQRKAYQKLAMLHSANRLMDLQSPPGNHLEKLHGDREGQYSIRVNDRWRICFEWHENEVYKVEIVDYHT